MSSPQSARRPGAVVVVQSLLWLWLVFLSVLVALGYQALSDQADQERLDSRLQRDTILVVSWPLCEVLLMNESRYPWLILVPRRPGATEIYQLEEIDQMTLLRESSRLGRALMTEFAGDKLNVAALGNVVSQLHVHHVVRFAGDAAWPGPVWGKHVPEPYAADALDSLLRRLVALLS